MLLLILSWAILFLTFISFGELFIKIYEKICGKQICNEYNFLDKFWIGVMLLTIFSIIVNYFYPLDINVLSIYVAGAFILNISFKIPHKVIGNSFVFLRTNKCLSVCFLIATLIVVFYSLYPNYIYDTGLYHIQTMKWHQQYPVVPGLGNLHGRLAFNSTTLIIYGLFNYQLGIFSTFTSISGLCIIVFIAWAFSKIAKLGFVSSCFLASIIILFITSFAGLIASYNTDLLPALLIITLITSFIFSENRWSKPIVFLCIPLLCATFKLSTAPICLLSIVYFIHCLKNKQINILLYCILFGACLIIPWLGRFVVETGYLIYPFPSIDIFSFDWKMPISDVIREKASVVAFTRMPGFNELEVAALPLEDWIKAWYFKISPFNSMFIVLTILSPILFFINYRKSRFNNAILICWLVAILGFIFSFNTAPATRFYYGFATMAATLPFLLLSDSKRFLSNGYFTKTYLANFLIVFILLLWIFKLAFVSILTDFHVQQYLFDVMEHGYIETRGIEEWFADKYLNKIIGFGILLVVAICMIIVYQNKKIKKMFLCFVNSLSSKKNTVLFSLYSFVLLIAILDLRISHQNSDKNIEALLIKPCKTEMIKPTMEKYQLSPEQSAYYPSGSDRCYDCDLPCSNYYNKHLEMRGSKLSDGFRFNDKE